jgi:hypothetical protein
MVSMLAVCEKYAEMNNIIFSTDPDPRKSKTKCIYVCGNMTSRDYPEPLSLNGRQLPFVTEASHLGHELTQAGTMEHDAKIKRADFIDKSVAIRETFAFAEPMQQIQAVEKYCGDHYGAMLWLFDGEAAGQYFRCWNRCVKLIWNVCLGCHTYFVDNLLAAGFMSTRHKVLSRYVNFFRGLLDSRSPEVALVANLAGRDMSSTTGRNLHLIRQETKLNPWVASPTCVKLNLSHSTVPAGDEWRLPVLQSYLQKRYQMELQLVDTKEINKLIDSLCIN